METKIDFIGTVADFDYIHTHKHIYGEMIFAEQGRGVIALNGRKFSISENDAVFCPSNMRHAIESEDRSLSLIYVNMTQHIPIKEAVIKIRSAEGADAVKTVLKLMTSIFYSPGKAESHILCTLYEAVYETILREHLNKIFSPCVEELKSLIEKNASDVTFSIASAVSNTLYCREYVSRCFHREIGMPPVKYLAALRIETAKKLLLHNPYYTIGDIAYMSGFCDQQYFTRVFKKLTGQPPTRFKNSALKN